ncbi:FkbM family methyltransferase, partial [Zavarzinella formosa]|uniref:FkbM family methyltransferase n=1 Tax=Zavarzinella formosa TaxID=360055 RepID=UPI00036D8FD8
ADSLSRTRPAAPGRDVVIRVGKAAHTMRTTGDGPVRVRELFEKQQYGGLPPNVLRPWPLIVDVGAGDGLFALYGLLFYDPAAIVHCFEPHLPDHDLLRENLRSFPGVTAHPFGLGKEDSDVDLLPHPASSGENPVRPDLLRNPREQVRTRIRSAAVVWDELTLGEADILKIDAGGCEADILEALGDRARSARVALLKFHTPAGRRRIDALLPGHELFGASFLNARTGILKYVRADLIGEGNQGG